MSLFLVEFTAPAVDRDGVRSVLATLAAEADTVGASLLDAQVSQDLATLFVVFEADRVDRVVHAVDTVEAEASEPAQVRLVGATVEEVRAHAGDVDYLVEWDLPAGLTMEGYLARKKEKSPLYAQVPEVTFLRTYVREDLGKCLCFYDAPDEAALCRARDAVGAPVDRLHRLAESPVGAHADARP